jgi:hypothetical protein
MDETLWGAANIIGPLILGAVLLWLVLRNRRSTRNPAEVERAERGAHDVYAEEEARRRDGTDGL